MSLIDASEDSTPSTAPIETLVVGDESAARCRFASTPLSASSARAGAQQTTSAANRAASEPEAEKRGRHQKACPMLT